MNRQHRMKAVPLRAVSPSSPGLTLFLSTEYVIEIINAYSITPLPLVPSFIKGIINLRGQILPVVDIRMCMGKPEMEYTNKTCIVVLNVDTIPWASWWIPYARWLISIFSRFALFR